MSGFARARRFVLEPWHLDDATGRLRLPYRFDDEAPLVETIDLGAPAIPLDPTRRALAERLAAYLQAAAGVSYYKAKLPPVLDLAASGLDAAAAGFVQRLYVNGLGEFAHTNGLDLRGHIDIVGVGPDLAPLRADLPHRALVPVGGGKDSLVTVEALRRSCQDQTLFAVNPKGPILATMEASGLPSLTVTRRLDPGLFALNAAGFWNGHVPITAIVSLIALLAAVWHGFDRVVMSNERSADAANLVVDGFAVNHQWSKSWAFEQDLRAELARAISPDLDWFSLLRPLSELAIARRFAAETRYDTSFSSCNRNFHLQGGGPARRWCRDCPKCRFVFLALAPFVARPRLLAIFDGDLLDDPDQTAGFAELAGLEGHKPFECVGETGEAAAALLLLADRAEWADRAVVRALAPQLGPHRARLEAHLEVALRPEGPHAIPPDLSEVLAT
ncbi:MAG: endonuclease domain-containing protein [Pseudomonadota bacterium]